MEFNDSFIYNCHCNLKLVSGREIILEKLTQEITYAGLLLGMPYKESNDRQIKSYLAYVAKENPHLGQPYLIKPERRDYFRNPGDMQIVIEQQQKGPEMSRHNPEWLPPVVCVATFLSLQATQDSTDDASKLVIVWYQHDFGIDSFPTEQLRKVDWEKHATDWSF